MKSYVSVSSMNLIRYKYTVWLEDPLQRGQGLNGKMKMNLRYISCVSIKIVKYTISNNSSSNAHSEKFVCIPCFKYLIVVTYSNVYDCLNTRWT
jgi:hypothetical protein